MTDRVTFVTVRSGGGNRYIASYFATLKHLGFSVVSSLNHVVNQKDYCAVYVLEHKESEGCGCSREAYDAAMNAMIERHVEANHNKPYVEGNRNCTKEIWYNNQRVDYTNEIRAWPNDA